METERRAVPGSLDLPEAGPGKVFFLLVNVGLYFGVVLSEIVLVSAVDRGRDFFLAVSFGLFFAVLSAPGLLVFAFALGFIPSAWPWWRKRLLGLAGSIAVVGGWLLLPMSGIGLGLGSRIGLGVWSLVLPGLIVFGLVCQTPQPNERITRRRRARI